MIRLLSGAFALLMFAVLGLIMFELMFEPLVRGHF